MTGCKNYTGVAWKHHVAEHFEDGSCLTYPNGAGKGATIFVSYDKMVNYLMVDGRNWYIAELDLIDEPLLFEYNNDFMATTIRKISSKEGFKPLHKLSQ